MTEDDLKQKRADNRKEQYNSTLEQLKCLLTYEVKRLKFAIDESDQYTARVAESCITTVTSLMRQVAELRDAHTPHQPRPPHPGPAHIDTQTIPMI